MIALDLKSYVDHTFDIESYYTIIGIKLQRVKNQHFGHQTLIKADGLEAWNC